MPHTLRCTLPSAPAFEPATGQGEPVVIPGALRAAVLCAGALLAVPAAFGQPSRAAVAAGPAVPGHRRRPRLLGPGHLRRAGRWRRSARVAGPRRGAKSRLRPCQRRQRAGRPAPPVHVGHTPRTGSAAVDRRRFGQLADPRLAGRMAQPGRTVLSPAAAFIVHRLADVRFVVAGPSRPAWTDMQAKPQSPHRRPVPAMRSRT